MIYYRVALQGSQSTTVDQLWGRYHVSWTEVRCLEVELGAGGDHDQAYAWSSPASAPHLLAWTRLRALREHGASES